MPRSRSFTRLTMRVGLEHFGQSVLLLVSMTFLRSPVLAIFAIMLALPGTNVAARALDIFIATVLADAQYRRNPGTSRKDRRDWPRRRSEEKNCGCGSLKEFTRVSASLEAWCRRVRRRRPSRRDRRLARRRLACSRELNLVHACRWCSLAGLAQSRRSRRRSIVASLLTV